MGLQKFDSGDVEIAFLDEGEGEPILLVHGFASNITMNWVFPGWVDALTRAGHRVIALDNRGHGESGKLYDKEAYGPELMAEDAARLLAHLEIERADVMGYSMGARIAAFLAIKHPGMVRSAIFGGLGMGMIEGVGESEPIAQALEAPSLNDVIHERGRAFRAFADQTRSDRAALAACIRGGRVRISSEAIGRIACPVLIVIGESDDIAGSGEELAELIPDAHAVAIPGRNHMQTVGDKAYKQAVLDFLGRRP